MGLVILITEVFEETSHEVNCNLQPDECNALAATKNERSPMCLVHLRRCRPGRMHARNISLQLLRCTSGQGACPRASFDMSFHLFSNFCL